MFRGDPSGPTRSEDAGNSGKSTTKIMKCRYYAFVFRNVAPLLYNDKVISSLANMNDKANVELLGTLGLIMTIDN